MKKRTRKLTHRLSALMLVIALVFTLVVQDTSLIVNATEEEQVESVTEDTAAEDSTDSTDDTMTDSNTTSDDDTTDNNITSDDDVSDDMSDGSSGNGTNNPSENEDASGSIYSDVQVSAFVTEHDTDTQLTTIMKGNSSFTEDENEAASYTVTLKSAVNGIDVSIDESEIEKIDDNIDLVSIAVDRDDNGNQTGTLTITVSDSCAGTGSIDLSSAITLSVDDEYKDSITLSDSCTVSFSTISVTVYQSLDIADLTKAGTLSFTADTESFVYGETISTGLTGTYDGVEIKVDSRYVSVETTSVGSQNVKISSSADLSCKSPYYQFTISSDVKVSSAVTITARPVYVKVTGDYSDDADIAVAYGSSLSGYDTVSDWLNAAAQVINGESAGLSSGGTISAVLVGDSYGAVDGVISGILTSEYNDLSSSISSILSDISFTLKAASDNVSYTVGTVSDVIGLTFSDGSTSYTSDSLTNYEFIFDITNSSCYGSLEVTEEELSQETIWDLIDISGLTIDDNGTFWVSGTGTLTFKIKDNSGQSVYDTVMVKITTVDEDGTETESTISGTLSIRNAIGSSESGAVTDGSELSNGEEEDGTEPVVTVYLKSSDGSYVTAAAAIPSELFTIDDLDPDVTLTTPAEAYDSTDDENADENSVTITFENYYSSVGSITFTVSDNSGIGIKTIQYAFLDLSKFEDLSNVTQEDLTEVVRNLSEDSWETYRESVSCSGLEDGKYLIAVKAVDTLGNTTIVISNGIIIDTTDPKVELTITGSADNTNTLYSGDSISYTATITDPLSNNVASGIDKIEVVVTNDGTDVDGSEESYTDSFTLEEDEGDLEDLTSTTNDDSVTYTLNGTATISSGATQKIVITVTAYDKAGNPLSTSSTTAVATSGELTADASKPVVSSVKYYLESDTDEEITVGTSSDDIYYANKNVVAKITVQEADIGDGNVYVTIDDGINNETYDINNSFVGLPDGVSLSEELETSGSGDNAETTYTLTFGGSGEDWDFVITSVSAKDSAGNEGDAYTTAGYFTVDQAAPVITISYETEDGEMVTALDNEDDLSDTDYVYLNESLTATIKITERNFDKDEVEIAVEKDGEDVNDDYEISWDDSGSESDIYTAMITFEAEEDADDDYSLVITSCEDKAGNAGTYTGTDDTVCDGSEDPAYPTHYFTIDTTDPKIEVAYYYCSFDDNGEIQYDSSGNVLYDEDDEITEAVESGNRKYLAAPVVAVVTITERNFGRDDAVSSENGVSEFDGQIQITYTAYNADGRTADGVTDYDAAAEEMGDWNGPSDDNKYSMAFLFDADANYTFSVSYTDLAGNESETNECEFSTDTTDPYGELSYESEEEVDGRTSFSWESLFDTICYTFFAQNCQELYLTYSDDTSGVKRVEFYRCSPDDDDADEDGNYAGLTEDELDEITDWNVFYNEGNTYYDSIKIGESGNEKTFVYVKITDYAGNVKYITNEGGIIVDREGSAAATITVSNENKTESGCYDGDVYFTVKVTENDGVCSGLEEVYYEIRNYYAGTDAYDVTDSGYILDSDDAGDHERIYEVDSEEKELELAIDASDNDTSDNDGNDVRIYVKTTDKAGNVSETETDKDAINIDVTAPEITVVYTDESGSVIYPNDDDDVLDDDYLYEDESVTATVTIDDVNFDPALVVFDIGFTDYEKNTSVTIKSDDEDFCWPDCTEFAQTKLDEDGSIVWTQSGTEWTAGITFPTEGDYSFNVSCTDPAGHDGYDTADQEAYDARDFTVDLTDPEVDVEYYVLDDVGNKSDITDDIDTDDRYKKMTVYAQITVAERNFYRAENEFADDVYATVTMSDAGKNVDTAALIADYEDQVSDYDEWENTSGTYEYTTTLSFSADANYTLRFGFTDLSDRDASCGAASFTVDKTDPEGIITIEDQNYSSSGLFEKIWFAIFEQSKQTFTVSTSDDTSGAAKVQYYKYSAKTNSSGNLTGMTEDELDDLTGWTTFSSASGGSVTVTRDSQTFLYVKITDHSGNVTYINTQEGVIVDNTDPADAMIEITTSKKNTITVNDSSVGLYDGDVTFKVTATDPTNDSTCSGLAEVCYEIRKDGTVTQSGILYECTTINERVQSVTRTATISSSKNNSNDVEIYVRVTDKAGNISEETKALAIDITEPAVSVVYGSDTAYNGSFYQYRTATITITEQNFDSSLVDLVWTNTDGASPGFSGWTTSGSGDRTTHTCTVTYSADGDYTFTVDATDLAGNTDNYKTVDLFTVDSTVPVISVTYNNNDSFEDGYYNDTRTATITVTEHNFRGSDFVLTVNGTQVSLSWSTSGDVHTATYTFSSDDDYTVSMTYTDPANNTAEMPIFETDFTVDTTAPTVTITGVENNAAYNGTITIYISYSDANGYSYTGLNSTTFTVTITNSRGETVALMAADAEETDDGFIITLSDFDMDVSLDDIYNITVVACDKAGNSNEPDEYSDITFSVNRYGSNYVLSDETDAFVDQYYSNEEEDIVITEINVNTLESHKVQVSTKNGMPETLTEGVDYEVSCSGGGSSWSSCTYTIDASVFEEEATYKVTVSSVDAAKNESDNVTWGETHDGAADIGFIIDKTVPVNSFQNLENEEIYLYESYEVVIIANDETAMGIVELTVNNQVIGIDEDDYNEDGYIICALPESSDWQTVAFRCTDAAGNESETITATVMVTTSRPALFMSRLRGCLRIGLLIILLIVFLILWKRRKDEEEKNTNDGRIP